ncbi:MAG: hypothetical protein LQ350_001837 [Teloschistes chrysophthalmus]|nr:MAG: hypothetical protein LQ350_001837 [Niorma chrysophthalma]
MAARREDRFLMRQRGAGARDIQLSFDLEIPGLPKPSRSPLKPQKSAENRQLPPPDLALSLKSHQTPNSTVARALSSLKSLSAAKKLGPAVPNPDTEGSNYRPPQDGPAVDTIQPIHKAGPGRKRKIVPASAEDEETPKVNSSRIRNNTLSTGQSSSHTASRSSHNTSDPTSLAITSSELATTKVGKPDTTEPASEQNLEQPQQSSDTTKTKDHVRGKQEVPKETKTRKRKPIEQAQRPKKKPKVILPDLQEEEANETAKLKESVPKQSEDLPQAAEAEPSVQEPSKNARAKVPKKGKNLLQASTAPEQTSGERAKEDLSEQASSHPTVEIAAPDRQPKKRGRKPKILGAERTEPAKETTQESVPDAVVEALATEVEPKKRGRKPKNLLDERVEIVKDSIQEPVLDAVTEASATEAKPKKRGRKPKIVPTDEVEAPADQHNREKVVNSGEAHQEALPPQEVQSQSSEGLSATKLKASKKEIVSQARKSRKKTVTEPILEQLPKGTTDDAKAESENDPVKTKAARKPPRKALSKETLLPSLNVDTESGKVLSDGPPEIGDQSAKTRVSVPKTRRAPEEKEQHDPHQTVKVPKKRGRPKKIPRPENEAKPTEPNPQPHEETLEEPHPPKTDLDQDVAAPSKSPAAMEPTPSTIPPQLANEPERKKKRGRPKKQQLSTALPAAENTSDSKAATRQTKTKTKPNPSTIVKNSRVAKASTTAPKAPRRLRPTAISYSYKDSPEDEDEVNASDDPISELDRVRPKASGATLDAADDVPVITKQTLPATTTIAPPPPSPLNEEIAHIPTTLPEPPSQTTAYNNLIKAAKFRKTNGDRILTTATATQTETIPTKGLENFVFSRVGRKPKAKAQAKVEGEELDPELQGLFDQVKGISSVGRG